MKTMVIALLFLLNIKTALAGERFECHYDSGPPTEIDYMVTGAQPRMTYLVRGTATGSIAFDEDIADLDTGESNSAVGDVRIKCIKKNSGSVTLTFEKDGRQLASCTINFKCTGEGETPKEK